MNYLETIPKGWTREPPPQAWVEAWGESYGPDVQPPDIMRHQDGRTALIGREPVTEEDYRWHISVRHGDPGLDGRVPNWGELVQTAHELRPGVVFVVGIPPRSWWMNVHPDVLHLWETTDAHLVAEWRTARRGDSPT